MNSNLFERSSQNKPYDAVYIYDKLSVWKYTYLTPLAADSLLGVARCKFSQRCCCGLTWDGT